MDVAVRRGATRLVQKYAEKAALLAEERREDAVNAVKGAANSIT